MKKLVSLALSAVLALSVVACGSSDTAASTTESTSESSDATASADGAFKIGGIGPITGGAAIYGQAVMNAAQMATDEINAAGGINGYQVEFRFEDDEHDAEKSVNAYNTLKDWGMQMLMGTVTSTPCTAVVAKTAEDNMFQLTPSGSAVESIAQPNAFRVCFSIRTRVLHLHSILEKITWQPKLLLFTTVLMYIPAVFIRSLLRKLRIRVLK